MFPIACGHYNVEILTEDGDIYVVGSNDHCACGFDSQTVQIKTLTYLSSNNRAIASGFNHSFALTTDDRLMGWGELGIPKSNFTTPIYFHPTFHFVQVACGFTHTVAITSDLRTFVWGSNSAGQLGISECKDKERPALLEGYTFTSVHCGAHHTAGVTSKGELYTWGSNLCGQLGLGDQMMRSTPVLVSATIRFDIVSCGYYHMVCHDVNGTAWSWGNNENGELGVCSYARQLQPTKIYSNYNFVLISCGHRTSIAIADRGHLLAWGLIIVNGNKASHSVPKSLCDNVRLAQCGRDVIIAVTNDNKIITYGGSFGTIELPSNKTVAHYYDKKARTRQATLLMIWKRGSFILPLLVVELLIKMF